MILTLSLSQNKFAVQSCDKARFILPPQRGQKHNLKYRDKNSKSSKESESFHVVSQITESFSNRGHICYPNSDNLGRWGNRHHRI